MAPGRPGPTGTSRSPAALKLMMRDDLSSRERKPAGFARGALFRAQAILARVEAVGDAPAIEKWRAVVSSLELEAAREILVEMRRAA